MKLHWSPRSPFVRKVMIALHELGLVHRLDYVRSPVRMTAPPNPEVIADNPLCKIPTLVMDDGTALFDSRVIITYLVSLAPEQSLIPAEFDARLRDMRWEAFGDGLLDVLLLWRTEELRGTCKDQVVCQGFDAKVRASLTQLNREAHSLGAARFGTGHIAIVCALGQLDFRYADCGWRGAFPALADWYDGVGVRRSVRETAVVDDNALDMGDIKMPLRFVPAPAPERDR